MRKWEIVEDLSLQALIIVCGAMSILALFAGCSSPGGQARDVEPVQRDATRLLATSAVPPDFAPVVPVQAQMRAVPDSISTPIEAQATSAPLAPPLPPVNPPVDPPGRPEPAWLAQYTTPVRPAVRAAAPKACLPGMKCYRPATGYVPRFRFRLFGR